jgi:nicotinamide-nucleotide amidase
VNRSDAREPNAAPLRRVALLSTGEELIRGAIADTNAPWIARTLKRLGALVVEARQVGDGRAAIAAAARELAARCDLLVVTGGLGPTADDRTREALADAAGVALREDAAARAQVEAYFARLGRTASASNRQQALLPAGARVVANPVGSARAYAESEGARARTARRAARDEVDGGDRSCRCCGRGTARSRTRAPPAGRRLAESVVGSASVMDAAPTTARLGDGDGGRVTICASDASDAAGGRASTRRAAMRAALGDHVFAEGDATLAETVVARLRETRRTVALAESCTGGLIAAALTDVPGSSEALLEGSVPYSEPAKIRSAGVTEAQLREHGAVSEEVARAMAEGTRARAGATFGVATTGIAGPGGGTAERPVGLVHFAVAGPDGVVHFKKVFPGDRAMVRSFAVTTALEMLRRALR